MDSIRFVQVKGLCIAAAVATLGGCTGGEREAAQLPDSAMLEVPADPAAAARPVQSESASVPRAEPPATNAPPTRPATPRPARTAPVLREPPPPRDTRPSIPYPPDTL